MPQRPLLESLFALGHIGELGRLLATFVASGQDQLGITELSELTSRTAGVSYRYPNPAGAIEVAIAIGFLRRSQHRLSLTAAGAEFLRQRHSRLADLSRPQGALVFSSLLDNEAFRGAVSELLDHFDSKDGKEISLRVGDIQDERLLSLSRLLQQLGLLTLSGGTLRLQPDAEFMAGDLVLTRAPLSESMLWQRLDEQRLRAKQIEEWVVEVEKVRLVAAKRPKLAEAVVRISEVNVAAGYDIQSYELDGSPRQIEVKSSSGRRVRFIWSAGQRQKAMELGRVYWIYFVPFAASSKRDASQIVMFQDPVQAVEEGVLVETPEAWVVVSRT